MGMPVHYEQGGVTIAPGLQCRKSVIPGGKDQTGTTVVADKEAYDRVGMFHNPNRRQRPSWQKIGAWDVSG